MERVIKTVLPLRIWRISPVFNQVYESYFCQQSCTFLRCSNKTLPKNVLCEIEAIAYEGIEGGDDHGFI